MDENGVHHHEWGDWEITIDGTYQQEGVKERVCTKCGEKETAKISRQVCLHKWGWVITQAQLLKEGGTKRHYTWTGFLDMIDHRHPVVRPKAFYVYSWCLIPRLYLPIISNSCYLQAFPESLITICYSIVSLSLLCPCLHNDFLFGKILVYSGAAYNPAKEYLVSLLCLYLQSGHFLSAIDSHATHATIAIMNHRLCGIFSTVFAK